jgi:succinate dehydrogenase / fumarate reductase flavoprotein subunit
MHGANRLGGNSLSDLLVFGRRAGEFAAALAKRAAALPDLDSSQVNEAARESLAPFEQAGSENPYAVHEELRWLMQNHVGIVRTEDELRAALDELAQLRERSKRVRVSGNIQYNPAWHLALDLKNMLDVSEAVTRAALDRQESRGAHTRDDFPDSDTKWGKLNVIVRQTPYGIQVAHRPLTEMPAELKQLLKEG